MKKTPVNKEKQHRQFSTNAKISCITHAPAQNPPQNNNSPQPQTRMHKERQVWIFSPPITAINAVAPPGG